MEMTVIDKAGCEFGRKTRDCLYELKQTYNREVSVLVSRDEEYKAKFADMEATMVKLDEKIDKLSERLSWMLGAWAVVGALIGGFLANILSQVLH